MTSCLFETALSYAINETKLLITATDIELNTSNLTARYQLNTIKPTVYKTWQQVPCLEK